ncbi:NAD(P)-dependent oxidoreductase [Terrihabitans soli]|uniref:NAD(P)-dependent oxidoreductase n=1 Tax=Terrihabitans soli TaxID=708113 RepID=A0A6S6QWX6_9HYPH|nr:SDR family oxidoreductase [Terrihabitans soli]BCJ92065.1 NAD(P)-dependent oxidoreductase [Terrihabitans soli]
MQTSTSDTHPFLLVLGMGYSAQRFVELYGERFARIAGTARSLDKLAARKTRRVESLLFDGAAQPELLKAAREASHVLVSIPPDERGDAALSALGGIFKNSENLRWIGYLSTTAVYGDRGGAWTHEDTPVMPQSARAKRRAEAETAWRDLAQPGRAVHVFRLSGIYGPGRNALVDLKKGEARRLTKIGQVFNRIHVDDIAAVLAAAIDHPQAGPVFNVADDEPAPSSDVVTFAAGLLGVFPPPMMRVEEANLSDMAKSFWSENKRIAPTRIKEELGLHFQFPTYREGLRALFVSGEGR